MLCGVASRLLFCAVEMPGNDGLSIEPSLCLALRVQCLTVSVRQVPLPCSWVGNLGHWKAKGLPQLGSGRAGRAASRVQTSLGGAGSSAGTKFLPITVSFQRQGWAGPKVVVNSRNGDVNRANEPLSSSPPLMKALGSGLCICLGFGFLNVRVFS